jgi:DNA uptake protein ComE-like DNA-binding protein
MASKNDANVTAFIKADNVKINFASVEELQKLPTVGKKTAEKKYSIQANNG